MFALVVARIAHAFVVVVFVLVDLLLHWERQTERREAQSER